LVVDWCRFFRETSRVVEEETLPEGPSTSLVILISLRRKRLMVDHVGNIRNIDHPRGVEIGRVLAHHVVPIEVGARQCTREQGAVSIFLPLRQDRREREWVRRSVRSHNTRWKPNSNIECLWISSKRWISMPHHRIVSLHGEPRQVGDLLNSACSLPAGAVILLPVLGKGVQIVP